MSYSLKSARTVVLSVLLLALFSSSSWAKFVHRVAVQQNGTSFFVTMDGRRLIRLQTSNGDLSAEKRASITADRLTAILKKGLDPASITCKDSGKNVDVMAGESLLAVATVGDAKMQNLTSDELAASWVKNLRFVLSLPPLRVAEKSIVIPIGESRAVKIDSLLADPLTAEVTNALIAQTDAKEKPGSIAVKALAVGDTTVSVKCGESKVDFAVTVKKYAAHIQPNPQGAIVTGVNPPEKLIRRVVVEAAKRSVVLEPGAKLESIRFASRVSSVSPGDNIIVPVTMCAQGEGYLPAHLSVPVSVENRQLPRVAASCLLYSNCPERLSKYQVLYTGQIHSGKKSVRLLFHHQNEMGQRIGIVVDLVNPSSAPASFHIVEGTSEPMKDTVLVGYVAGSEFLSNYLSGTGRIVEVPAKSRRVLVSQSLPAGYTSSGVIELRQFSGEASLVTVTAKPEEQRISEDAVDLEASAQGVDASKAVLSDHVYPSPYQKVQSTYTEGKQWLFLRLGNDPVKHASKKDLLYGNYGVLSDIQLKLENPTSNRTTVELAFEATAGPAGGIFVIDGKSIRVRTLLPPKEVSLGTFSVLPHSTRIVNLHTMPLSGSAYPATIIVRPAGVGSAFLRR